MWKQQKKARFGYITSPHTPSASRSRSRPSGSLAPWAKVFACSPALASEENRRTTVSSTIRHPTPSRGSMRGPCARRCAGRCVVQQPDGPGKGAFAAIHPETAIGGVFNRIRLEHMEREGVDAQVLYGSMTLSFESILDPELAVACMRAYNDYIADDCRPYAGRLFPVGYLSLADVGEAVKELRRCVLDLGMIGVHAPPSLPVPHPAA